MFDSVRFASVGEVIAYVERSLADATRPGWDWAPVDLDPRANVLRWDVFPAGEQPGWSNRFVLHAPSSGEFFVLVHGNSTRGLFNRAHCLENATVIHRTALGMSVNGNDVTLAELLRHLFETCTPNAWDPT